MSISVSPPPLSLSEQKHPHVCSLVHAHAHTDTHAMPVDSKVGRIGGSNASASMRAFSDGVAWSNLELPSSAGDFLYPWRSSNSNRTPSDRRAPKAKSGKDSNAKFANSTKCDSIDAGNATNVTLDCIGTCSFHWLAPSAERLISCVAALGAVSSVRTACSIFIQRVLKRPLPPMLHFPCWVRTKSDERDGRVLVRVRFAKTAISSAGLEWA